MASNADNDLENLAVGDWVTRGRAKLWWKVTEVHTARGVTHVNLMSKSGRAAYHVRPYTLTLQRKADG